MQAIVFKVGEVVVNLCLGAVIVTYLASQPYVCHGQRQQPWVPPSFFYLLYTQIYIRVHSFPCRIRIAFGNFSPRHLKHEMRASQGNTDRIMRSGKKNHLWVLEKIPSPSLSPSHFQGEHISPSLFSSFFTCCMHIRQLSYLVSPCLSTGIQECYKVVCTTHPHAWYTQTIFL